MRRAPKSQKLHKQQELKEKGVDSHGRTAGEVNNKVGCATQWHSSRISKHCSWKTVALCYGSDGGSYHVQREVMRAVVPCATVTGSSVPSPLLSLSFLFLYFSSLLLLFYLMDSIARLKKKDAQGWPFSFYARGSFIRNNGDEVYSYNEGTKSFHMYKLELDPQSGKLQQMLKLENFKDNVLFVGDKDSIYISTSYFSGCLQKDSIYYANDFNDDAPRPYPLGLFDLGIYNVNDGSFINHCPYKPCFRRMPPPF